MRDLRPELFVEAYRKTGFKPIKGRWMGYGTDTRDACGLSCLAIHEAPDCERGVRGRSTTGIREVVARALGISEADAGHFVYVWDHGEHPDCHGCDVCSLATQARMAVNDEIGPIKVPRAPHAVRPML